MANKNIDSTDFKNFLLRFFEKDFNISSEMLLKSEKFLFDGAVPDITDHQDFLEILTDLREIMERNNLKKLNDLIVYYDNKRKKMNSLLEKLEETNPEEFLAINFQHAITMYTKTIKADQILKSTYTPCLYYLNCSENTYPVSLCIPYKHPLHTNNFMSYNNDDEIKFLTQIKGTLLTKGKKECGVSEERTTELISN